MPTDLCYEVFSEKSRKKMASTENSKMLGDPASKRKQPTEVENYFLVGLQRHITGE